MRLASTKLCRGRRKGVIRRLDFRLGVIGAGRWQERALGLCILLHSSCIVLASDVLGCRDDTAIYVTMGIVPNSALRVVFRNAFQFLVLLGNVKQLWAFVCSIG